MQHYETYGAKVDAQKEWEDTGCVAILQEQSKSSDLEDWEIKQRWKHLLLLDPGLQGLNNQAILDEPFCLGARIRVLAKSPSPVPWRYDIVDTKTKTIIISIVKGN